ncbi:hypothetical protein J2X72_004740 [Phyllobacterium sp. 1468]|uniref:hypothetical protein n=1 Tax=Phyllobacterium sp. 1468 TaxID=2817759 RepID=UPI0028604439|nr:hypothetical protein [Phyllobacterium sp. 1468]MDR6635926.1 hypothetical protein [Phyllobacterium sp. 1468]
MNMKSLSDERTETITLIEQSPGNSKCRIGKEDLLAWLDSELINAKDTIGSIERGERYQLIRLKADGMVDETQSTYIKAMRDTMFLELLLKFLNTGQQPEN